MAAVAIVLGLSASSPTYAETDFGAMLSEHAEQEAARRLGYTRLERVEAALPFAGGRLVFMPGMTIGVRQSVRGLESSQAYTALREQSPRLGYQIEQEARALEASVSYGFRFSLTTLGYEVVLHPDDVARWSSDRGSDRGNPEVNQDSTPDQGSLMRPDVWLEWSLSLQGAVVNRYMGFLVSDVMFRLNVELRGAHPGTNFGSISIWVRGRLVTQGPSGRQYTFVVLPPAIEVATAAFGSKMAELVGETSQYLREHRGRVIGRTSDGFAIVALGRNDGLVGSHEGNGTPGSRVRVGEYVAEVYATAYDICLLAPKPVVGPQDVTGYQELLTQYPPVTPMSADATTSTSGLQPEAEMLPGQAGQPGGANRREAIGDTSWRQQLLYAQAGQVIDLPIELTVEEALRTPVGGGLRAINVPKERLLAPQRGLVVRLVPPEGAPTDDLTQTPVNLVLIGSASDASQWTCLYTEPRRSFTAKWQLLQASPENTVTVKPTEPEVELSPNADTATPFSGQYAAFLNAVAHAEVGTMLVPPKFNSVNEVISAPTSVLHWPIDVNEDRWKAYQPGMVGRLRQVNEVGAVVLELPAVVALYTKADGISPHQTYRMHVWILVEGGGALPPKPENHRWVLGFSSR